MFLSDGHKLMSRAPTSGPSKLTIPARLNSAPGLRLRVGLPPRVLRRVEEFIDVHRGEIISLYTHADVAGLSPSHFSRMFKQSKGVSPGNYLVRLRMQANQAFPEAATKLACIT